MTFLLGCMHNKNYNYWQHPDAKHIFLVVNHYSEQTFSDSMQNDKGYQNPAT